MYKPVFPTALPRSRSLVAESYATTRTKTIDMQTFCFESLCNIRKNLFNEKIYRCLFKIELIRGEQKSRENTGFTVAVHFGNLTLALYMFTCILELKRPALTSAKARDQGKGSLQICLWSNNCLEAFFTSFLN